MIQYSSKEARQNWRKILDTVLRRESDVLIERNGEPIAVILPVADYAFIREALVDYRDGLEADSIYQAWKAGQEESLSISEAMREMGLDE
ncbi:MAG: type II toxin-antitoxin system Phd/YefM family antitoxin [Anaerolineae bacterium]|nr:type II toxin-antitoxin system Phd/YefM family antitoxin [Anaerolineae bacterium]